tara:strand:- start:749 stop:1156 length:408 start_codon:yes stop_codon:yes gene_type:complete
MRNIIARFLCLVPSLIFLSNAYSWVTNPSKASSDLGMPYLEGIGRSSQIGDFSAFFIGVGIFCFIGGIFKNISFLIAAIIILISAAAMRIIAWQLYSASFATLYIAVEIVSSIMLLSGIILFQKKEAEITNNEVD